MAKPNRLQEVEQEHGIPLDQLIPALVNELGSQRAAADYLGVSASTINTWLKENGYTPLTIYVKEGTDDHEHAG